MKNSSQSVPMTEGSIARRLTAFAIPLFLGNLFQQLYNTADSLIVGNFLGSEALAAVSSSGSLIFLMVGFFNGISIGAGVVIARYYGARQIDRVQKAIHTTVAFGLVAGVLLTVIGLVLAPLLLVWMGTPENVLPNSIVYFRIYFCGSIAFVLYNIFVGILQSVGDSTHPLIYLIISSVVNIVLDLLFVGGFHMGVGSAAFATILSQFVSAILCLIQLLRSPEEYRIDLKKIRFHGFFQVVFFLPNIISLVVLCMLVRQMFSSDYGPIALLFEKILGHPTDWIGYQSDKLWGIITIFCIWAGLGGNSIVMCGAMRRIPEEIFEAARLDGVGFWREMITIVLPLILPSIGVFFISIITSALSFTMQPMLIAVNPGIDNKYMTIGWYIFTTVEKGSSGSMIRAACIGITFSLILLPIIIATRLLVKKVTPEVEF